MPLYNEILQGRQQNLLTKFFAMVGGSPAPQLAPEVAPSWNLDNVDHDTAVLQGYRWCMAGENIGAGGAGNFTKIQLRNGASATPIPLSLIFVRSIQVSLQTAGVVVLQRITPPATTVSSERKHQDFRINVNDPLAQSPHDLTSSNNTAVGPASANTMGIWRVGAATPFIIPCHIVLAPTTGSSCIEVVNATANDGMSVTFEYYYREMAPGELVL